MGVNLVVNSNSCHQANYSGNFFVVGRAHQSWFVFKSWLWRSGLITLLTSWLWVIPSLAQDWIKTGTGLGVEKVRLAAADFKGSTPNSQNPDLLKVFNDTLWNDLDNA